MQGAVAQALRNTVKDVLRPKSTPPSFLDQAITPQEEDGVLCQNANESQDNEELATTVVTLDTRGLWED